MTQSKRILTVPLDSLKMFRFIALLAILAVAFGGAADSKVSALIVLKTPHDLLDSTVLEDLPFLSL